MALHLIGLIWIKKHVCLIWMTRPNLSNEERGSMPRLQATSGAIVCAVLCLNISIAKAGPCSADIAQFEHAIRQSAGNRNAGLTAPQSVAAQLDRQPKGR